MLCHTASRPGTGADTTTDAIDPPDRLGSYGVPRLGVDRKGREHFFDNENGRILVADDGDVVHVQDLDGRPVVEWVAYVAEKACGWETKGKEQLIDALAGAF